MRLIAIVFLLALAAVALPVFAQLNPDATLKWSPNAYGLGTHADQYGRPGTAYTYPNEQPSYGRLQMRPNAYGPGIHADQYGRPVVIQPWGLGQ